MDALTLVVLFVFFLATSLPIGVAIGVTIITFTFFYPVANLTFIPQNMFSSLNSFPLMAVPFFMLTGTIMEIGGLSRRLVNVANKLVGNTTSGLAMVTVLACMFFGAISGSSPATVAAIGGLMVPSMVKHGYSREFGSGLICTAGSLGIIIPPSIPLVIYGVGTMTSVGDLFLAGIGPGICLMITSVIVGRKRGYKGTGESFSIAVFLRAVWDAKWALLVPLIILGGIYGGIFTPTEASIVGVVYALVVSSLIYREITLDQLMQCFISNAALVGVVFFTLGVATSLAFLVSVTGLPERITELMMSISSNKYVILTIVNIFLLLVGMVMDTTPANIIFSPLLLGIMAPLGVDPVHFGIIMTVNLALGFCTPPMAVNIFLTSTITGVPVPKIVKESLPFVGAMLIALFIITYVPAISLGILWLVR